MDRRTFLSLSAAGTLANCCGVSARAADPVADINTAIPTPPVTPQSPTSSPPSLPNSELAAVHAKVRQALDIYRTRYLNTRDHSPWEVMHSFIGYGIPTMVRRDGPEGEPVTAIGWLCYNHRCKGQNLFYQTRTGIGALKGVGVQGHHGQFLGMLAQSKVKRDYPIRVNGKDYTVADLIKFEQDTCEPQSELTFKLISLAHYLDSDATWRSNDGQQWSIERLVREEIAQPIRTAACGGTHRLFALSYAFRTREKRGEPVTGDFQRAEVYIKQYQAFTFKIQNPDGSFSTDWFNGRGNQPDLDRKLQTTGHILEWLAFSLSPEDLQHPRTIHAVNFLSGILIDNPQKKWAIGPLGHAIHSLVMVDNRLTTLGLGPERPSSLAEQPSSTSSQR